MAVRLPNMPEIGVRVIPNVGIIYAKEKDFLKFQ